MGVSIVLCWLILQISPATQGVNPANVTYSLFVFIHPPDADEPNNLAFDQGLSIIPAVELAVKHINERTDLRLPGTINSINVISKVSGCDRNSETVVSIVSSLREFVLGGDQPIAIIGPVCSEASQLVINTISKALIIPVLHCGTSPRLSEQSEIKPNAFGMISSADVLVDTLIRIANEEKWNWKNIAILYDDLKDNRLHTYETFIRKLNSSLELGYSNRITSPQISIDDISSARNIRIVVVFSSKELAHQLVCLVGQKEADFVFPIHQLIFIERSPTDFLQDDESDTTTNMGAHAHSSERSRSYCSQETMIKGLEGSVFLNQALDSVDPDIVTVSNYTVGQIKEQYKSILWEYSKAYNITLPESNFAYPYYDAVWTFILGLFIGLNSSKPLLASINDAILNNVSFQGISSWIDFSNRHHVTNPVSIDQAIGGTAIKKGQQNRSNLTYAPQTFVSDKFMTEDVAPHHALVALGFLLAVVLLLVTVIMQMMTIVYRNSPSLKATSAQLNHFIFLGCYLFLMSLLVDMFQKIFPSANDNVLCNLNIYSNMLGSCFIFGTILMKSWRIYRIFEHVFTTSRSHQRSLHIAALAAAILALALIMVALCIPALVLTPFRAEKTRISYDTSHSVPIQKLNTECHIETFTYVTIPLLFLLCVKFAAVILATLNRHIKRKHFQTTKKIVILVYLLTIMWSIGGPLIALFHYLDLSINITYAFYSCLLVTTVILCQAMLIMPSLMPLVLTRKDRDRGRLSHSSITNNRHLCIPILRIHE